LLIIQQWHMTGNSHVRTIFHAVLIFLMGGWVATAHALPCDRAFTRMELTICGSTSLREKYEQLEQLSDRAVDSSTLSRQAVDHFKDELARTCSDSDDLNYCLHQEISKTSTMLSGMVSEQKASSRQSTSSIRKLQLQREQAEIDFLDSGNPEMLVVALLSLLQRYEETSNTVSTALEIEALGDELMKGCRDLSTRRRWNRALQSYGRSCPLG